MLFASVPEAVKITSDARQSIFSQLLRGHLPMFYELRAHGYVNLRDFLVVVTALT